jgi:N6-adenosine-specific RNA methylase IME4
MTELDVLRQDDWLNEVIQQAKNIIAEFLKETFVRYRRLGQLILESGYKKGQWQNEDKQGFLNALGIEQKTFSNMVRLGEMNEQEFSANSTKFSSVYAWVHQKSLAKTEKRQREIIVIQEAIKHLEAPQQKYDVIVIDPPWPYGSEYDPESRRVASPYPEMSIEEITSIPVPCAENSILWLWTTNAFMKDAFHILDSWGFEPKTILTWAKDRIGIGYYLRGQTEHCILATKGNPNYNTENAQKYSTLLHAKNEGHSQKPQEFYDLVDAICLGWKLDYYGRKKREGWHVFGTLEGDADNGIS